MLPQHPISGQKVIFIEQQITRSPILCDLIAKMEHDDLMVSRRLSTYISELLKTFPLTRISTEIGHLLGSVEAFRENIQDPFVNILKNMNSEKNADPNALHFCSRDIRYMESYTREYSGILQQYHSIFYIYQQHETRFAREMAHVSEVEQALLNLILLIEKQISSMKVTAARLAKWKLRSLAMEIQAIYN